MDINGNNQYKMYYRNNETVGCFKGYRGNTEERTGKTEQENGEQKSFLQQMKEHMDKMRDKIKNGTIQPTFQTGARSYTKEEWEKLLEKFDEAEEILRAEIEAEMEAAKEKAQKAEQTDGETAIDAAELLTEEITQCTYPTDNPEEKRLYITCYTKEGIFCKESVFDGESWTSSDFWSIPFTEEGQYERVMAFLERFPSDGNLRFAAHENFWQDFLAGDLDEDAFVAFFETTKDGVPDYTFTDGDSTYIDKDKVKWAKYMNPFGIQFYTEEEILAWQDAIIRENQKKLNKLSDYDGALQRPDDIGDKKDEEEERTEIITKPDGTKILQIITPYGVTSFEIAKGQELSSFPAYVKAVYEKTNGTTGLSAPERKA